MTPEERLKFTRARRLCDNCLMVGHRAAQCSKPATCSVAGCGKKHTKFLHQINSTSGSGADALSQHTNQQQQPNPEGEITGAHCGLAGAGSKARVALPVVPVRVRAKGSTQFVDTCALLDSGSTNTFCSEELCKLLGVEGRSETFSLTTLDKANSVEETKVVSLKISSLDSKVTINLPRVYTRKILPISSQNVATGDDVKAWPHLHDIELPNIDGLNIMLLIGQDIPEAMLCYETRQGPKGSPYGMRTSLGWTVNGPLTTSSSSDVNEVFSNFINTDDSLNTQVEKFWNSSSESIVDSEMAMRVVI